MAKIERLKSKEEEYLRTVEEKKNLREVLVDFLPTGSTMLNLAFSGRYDVGIPRARVTNLVGDGSSGKCCRNTLILNEKEGMQYIDDLCENLPYGASKKELSVSVEKDNFDSATYLWKEKVYQTLYVKTRHGFENEMTYDHRLRVLNKDMSFSMIRAGDLKAGDILVVSGDTQVFSEDYYYDGDLKVDESVGELLGIFIADGNFPGIPEIKGNIRISTSREYLIDRLNILCERLGLKIFSNGKYHYIGDKFFAENIYSLCGFPQDFTARYKYVPKCILQSPKSVQARFLRALIDADGHAKEKFVEYYTSSERLGKEVQLMLLNMGIICSRIGFRGARAGKKYYDHIYYRLRISVSYIEKYLSQIGTLKNKFLFDVDFKDRKICSNFDSIPYCLENIKHYISDIREAIGWHRNGKISDTGERFPRFLTDDRYMVTKDRLKIFLDLFEEFEEIYPLTVFRDLEKYHFDPIEEIRELNYDNGVDVYDMYIPKNHLFWGNGLINHNTIVALNTAFEYLKNIYQIKSNIFSEVKKARVIYNNGEAVMDFPINLMFGKKFNELVEWKRSKNIEAAGKDFLSEAYKLKPSESLLYIIDSWDSFRSVHQDDICSNKEEDNDQAYDFSKQRYAWKFFAQVCDIIEDNKRDATLIVISQTRSKIGVLFGKKKYRTGGDALNFYTHLVPWLRVIKKQDKTKLGEKRVYAIDCEAKVERTKVGLPFRQAKFRVLFDHGIDDISSMGQYLKDHNLLEYKKIPLKDLHQFSVEIEKRNLQDKLRKRVSKIWTNVENAFREEINEREPKRL